MIVVIVDTLVLSLQLLNAGREGDVVGIIVEFHLIISCVKKVYLIVVLQLGILL